MKSNKENNKRKIIIDTDIGDDVDDALAVAFAMLRPELEVRLVSAVFGPVGKRKEMVDSLLKVIAEQEGLDRSDLPKTVAGYGEPLSCGREAMESGGKRDWTPNQYAFALENPASGNSGGAENVLDLFEDEVLRQPGEISLATIGAMTNAARFIIERPEAAKQLNSISVMGGSFLEEKIEYNVICDPEAARIVMESDIPTAVFSWETSGKLLLDGERLDRLNGCSKPAAKALARFIELWWPAKGKKRCPVLYDVCALLWFFRPDLFKIERHDLKVKVEEGPENGKTLLTGEGDKSVAMDMDEQQAADIFIETICG